MKTNQIPKPKILYFEKKYDPNSISLKPGSDLAFFHLGSTIVLIFESPEFKFSIKPHQKVKLGEPLGYCSTI